MPYCREVIFAFMIVVFSAIIPIPMPLLYKKLLDNILPSRNIASLFCCVLTLIILTLGSHLFTFFQTVLFSDIRKKIFSNIRLDIYKHLQKMSCKFYSENQTGRLLSRIVSDVDSVQNLLADKFIVLIKDVFLTIIVILIMFNIHWQLSLLTTIMIPFFFLIFGVFGEKIQKASRKSQENQEVLLGLLQEDISSTKLVQSFTIEKYKMNQACSKINITESMRQKLDIHAALASLSSVSIVVIGIGILWGYGGYEVIKNSLTIGSLIAFTYYLNYLYGPFSRVFDLNIGIQSSLAAAKRIFEILDITPEIKDEKNAQELLTINGNVEFKNIFFGYEPHKIVLKDINLSVESGKVIGIVGTSGTGKTTLVNLIPRFYDPTEGTIFIDGYDLKKIKIESLRRQIGIVSQDIFLFNTTIGENISMGRHKSDDSVLIAAKIANAHNFIIQLPQGYDTFIGENGVKLSSGQRQQLAIARALYSNPRILILDEATSALDSSTERDIQETLKTVIKNRTVFIIAHRFSTLAFADKIIVLGGGKIAEIGTHLELLKIGGVYKKLFDEQFLQGD